MPSITTRGLLHVELAGGVIVEKEQRLGALHHDVVDAHRDQILADAVKAPRLDGDLELGADAVGGGDQQRVLETGRLEVEQPAKAAQVRVRAGAARVAFAAGRDALDQRLAGVDVHARVFICRAFRRAWRRSWAAVPSGNGAVTCTQGRMRRKSGNMAFSDAFRWSRAASL